MTSPTTTQPAARSKPPAGAAGWSRTYVDAKGLPHVADQPVPVDADGRITEHVQHTCRGSIEVDGVKQPCDHVLWLTPGAKVPFCPDHGVQLQAGKDTSKPSLIPWTAIGKAMEPSARPWWALLAEGVCGAGVHAGHVPWWALLPAAPVFAAGGYQSVRTYLTRRAVRRGRLEKGQRSGQRWDTIQRRARAAGYMGAAGGAWLTAFAAVDPATPEGAAVGAAGVAAWAVSAATWWNYQNVLRNRPEPEPAAPAAQVEVKASADELSAAEAAKAWNVEVALPGTHLDPATWQQIACGWQAVIVATKKGALNQLGGDNMKGTVRRIAAAFDVPKSAITWIEEFEDSPNRALLLVQPNNPLKDGQLWPGPDSIVITDSGIRAEVGTLIDGNPMVEPLYRFGWGAPSGVDLGTTGGGKSMRARKKLVIERWTSFEDPATKQRKGLFLSFLHDPKRLESYAEFRNAVHGYGITRDDAHIMIDALLREMFRRYDMLAGLEWEDRKGRPRKGGIPWDPRVHGPVISVYWDEFHELAADQEFVKKLEKLARYQRACGMRGELLSHMGTIGDTGSQALRDMLAGGRATLFRTTSGLNASLATGGQLTADPRALPKVPGMCLVADGETATIMGRESYIPADDDAHDVTLYDWLFDDDNEPVGYPAQIPAETVRAFGPEFMEWMEAGRRAEGRSAATGAPRPAAAGVDLSAVDALRRILAAAAGPVTRDAIVNHPLWGGRGATSTLTGALRAGQDAGWVVKQGVARSTTFELSPAERERLEVEAAETAGAQ